MQNRFYRGCLAGALMLAVLAGCASAPPEAAWPEPLVGMEQMRSHQPWQAQIPRPEADMVRDRSGNSKVVLQVHVDADGQVLRVRVAESSGNPALDAAALQAMQALRFDPYGGQGAAQAVTVMATMRFPFYDRPR